MAKKKMASVLAFEKKLVPSVGYLYQTSWDNRKDVAIPLGITEKSVRGTISNRLDKKMKDDVLKIDAAVENANLQVVDDCALGLNYDTLKLNFSLKILSGAGIPSACNDEEFQRALSDAVIGYTENHGFRELGKRYAINLANGRFLWRNRLGAEQVEVIVRIPMLGKTYEFDSLSFSLKDFSTDDAQALELGDLIASTLSGKRNFLMLEVDAYAQIGNAQEVYPSQELVLDKKKSEKSKILYKIGEIAGIHSQKIGNAIRTIDTFFPEFSTTTIGPIAVEPYGAVTTLGKAFRTPVNKKDFYTLFDYFVWKNRPLDVDDEHYVMAVLTRGGVFGESSKE
jgi:CRISPR-associated protein Csy3